MAAMAAAAAAGAPAAADASNGLRVLDERATFDEVASADVSRPPMQHALSVVAVGIIVVLVLACKMRGSSTKAKTPAETPAFTPLAKKSATPPASVEA